MDKRVTTLFRAKRVTTLFIEDTHIRLLAARGNQVEQWASAPLEPGLVSGGIIRDEDRVAEKLRELFLLTKLGKDNVIVGLNGLDSLYRLITLPELPVALIPEAVQREAARVLPISLDELYLSYQRIPGPTGENLVFVAVFPKSTTDILIRALRKAGIVPAMLDLAPLALCRVANEPRAIIVDTRLDHLDIIVMVDRVPQVIRSLALQSEAKTLPGKLPTISEELSRTVAFYNSSHQQNPLDSNTPVLVSGELAESPDVWKSLVGKLISPVSALRSTMEQPANLPLTDFMVNLGLASKDLSLEKETANFSLVNFNVLPKAYLPERPNPVRVVIPVVAAVGIIALFFMWLNLRTNTTTTPLLNSELQTINSNISQATKDIAAITEQNRLIQAQIQSQLETQIQPLTRLGDTLKAKINSMGTMQAQTNNDTHRIVSLKPDTVTLLGVTYSTGSDTGNQISVNGLAPKQADVLGYAQVLRDTGGFTVIVSSIQYNSALTDTDKTEWYTFHLQLN